MLAAGDGRPHEQGDPERAIERRRRQPGTTRSAVAFADVLAVRFGFLAFLGARPGRVVPH